MAADTGRLMDDWQAFCARSAGPPVNFQAEQALLGAILANNRVFDLCPGLEPWHFDDPFNAEVFAAIKRRISAGESADPVILKAEFGGHEAELAALISAVVSINIAPDYAATVIDCALRRQLWLIGDDLMQRAHRMQREHGDGADSAALAIDNIDEAVATSTAAIVTSLGAAAEQRLEQPTKPWMTGLEALDERWGGLFPASLEIVGARPRTGKTAFGAQVARMLAQQGHKVGFFSLEVPKADFAAGNLASVSLVGVHNVRTGELTVQEAHALMLAQRKLDALPISVIDCDLTLSNLISQMRGLTRRGVKIFIIDHRNEIDRDPGCERMTKLDWYSHITKRLKKTAKRLEASIILLVQCRRDTEQREDSRPRMSDLEYSGEQDADNVLLLHRPELDMERPPLRGKLSAELHATMLHAWYAERGRLAGVCDVIFAKRRFGLGGTVRLHFHGSTLRFTEPPSDPPDYPAELL
jgi:replicative DNA helicase